MSNLDIIKEDYAALMRGDVSKVIASFDENIEWNEAEGHPYRSSGEAWFGPDAIVRNLFDKIETEWDGFVCKPSRFHDAGDSIIVEGRYTGKYIPTGKTEDAQFCHIWTLRDGKVIRFQQYLDTAQLQDVMQV